MHQNCTPPEFTAYHVVTDRPMHIGQHIFFDETHHNGVWRRVMEKRPIVEEIYAHPERFDAAALEHHTAVALRELALEEVRLEKYPDYPSRLSCLYVSQQLSDSKLWSQLFVDWKRPTYHIVKLKVRGSIFVGDANNCFSPSLDKAGNRAMADHYWQNLPNANGESPIWETLAAGDIEVLEIVEEIRKNI